MNCTHTIGKGRGGKTIESKEMEINSKSLKSMTNALEHESSFFLFLFLLCFAIALHFCEMHIKNDMPFMNEVKCPSMHSVHCTQMLHFQRNSEHIIFFCIFLIFVVQFLKSYNRALKTRGRRMK